MRVRAVFAFALVVALLALGGACKSKGNGVGTAPGNVTCPDIIVAGTPCAALIMCGVCGGTCGCAMACGAETGACPAADASIDGEVDGDASVSPATISDPAFFMYCPGGTGAVWECVQSSDGGTFSDAEAGGESEVDGDVAEADAAIDGDAEAASDADATDAGVDGDAAEAAEADAIVDTAPEVGADVDADGG